MRDGQVISYSSHWSVDAALREYSVRAAIMRARTGPYRPESVRVRCGGQLTVETWRHGRAWGAA